MKTAIVILNWNGKEFLERFLPGLVRYQDNETSVIVADNGSTDGSAELLKEKFPQVGTMFFSVNHGYTGGYNRALMQLDAEYYVLLNSDIEVGENWLAPLTEWMDTHPRCGACAPKILSWKDRDTFEYAGAAGGYIDRFGYPFCRGRVLGRTEKDSGQYDVPAEVFWASGACLVIRAEVFRKLGGLDEKFFAHMEEIDLCWRAQLHGWEIYVVPQSSVYHIGGGSLSNESPRKLYLNYRNNLLMLRKNLAFTEALRLYKAGYHTTESAEKGLKRARRKIVSRIFIDGLSSLVYLMCLNLRKFKAVSAAHRDFLRIRDRVDVKEIRKYLKEYGKTGQVYGIAARCIIPAALLSGERIFGKVSRTGFLRKKI